MALCAALIFAIVVYIDARRLSDRGADLSPLLWALVVFLLLVFSLPIYLILRFTVWQRQIDERRERRIAEEKEWLEASQQRAVTSSSLEPSNTATTPVFEGEAAADQPQLAGSEDPAFSGNMESLAATAAEPAAVPGAPTTSSPPVLEALGEPAAAMTRETSVKAPALPDPGLGTALVWCFLLLLSQFGLGVVIRIVMAAEGEKPDTSLLLVIVFALAPVTMIFLALVFLGRRARRALAWRRARPLHLALAVLLVPPSALLTEEIAIRATHELDAMFEPAPQPRRTTQSTPPKQAGAYIKALDEEFEKLAQQPWLAVFIVGCLLPGVGEEIFFRGLLGRGLVARYGVLPGVLFTSILFGAMHIDPVRVCYATVFGIVLHLIYLNAKSLLPAMLLHMSFNALSFTRAKLGLSGAFDLSGMDVTRGLPTMLVAAALVAVAVLLYIAYRSRTWWSLADGAAWSPGYATAEMPPRVLHAAARWTSAGIGAGLVGLGSYVTFGCGVAFLAPEWLGLTGAWPLIRQGEARLQHDDFRGAVNDFSEALRLDPSSPLAYMAYAGRGEAYRLLGEPRAAIADCDRALSFRPDEAYPYAVRAAARQALGDLGTALQDSNEAVRRDPKFHWAYQVRGVIHQQRGEYGPAAEDLKQAINLGPNEPWSFRALAWQLATCPDAAQRNGKKAVEYATRACELTGWRKADMLTCLAAAYAENGDFDLAIKRQEEALRLAQDDELVSFQFFLQRFRSRRPLREKPAEESQ
jgi:membrane protease YdiL (CAAX protease family)/tetratricopeptide (TPR) repeat protein